ncbi:hypothetical protein [Methylobacterium sp. WL18]|nr:hypothetical protein [Methylobacterium sp. WL18]
MTLISMVVIAYACRRPLAWISMRMIAFAVGFFVGWQFMARR